MAAKGKIFMNYSKNTIGICKNKYYWHTRYTLGITDVEEKIWLTNTKYLWLSLNTSWALVFCIDINICTISREIGVKKEK